jgi:two-component system, NarL family, sensor kinase
MRGERDTHLNELQLLKEIAETINRAYDMEPMLQDVLEKLLELTGLKAGWVFLFEPGGGHYRCAADCGLPPALAANGKAPMEEGECWCTERFRDGRLNRAVNILGCKRLEDAVELKRGDTEGITHHATIPLRSGSDLFGILNVASPGKTAFSNEELALLQSVAYQIGTAAHRIRLYGKERKRADLYESLGAAARRLSSRLEFQSTAEEIVQCIGEHFRWAAVALHIQEKHGLYLKGMYSKEDTAAGAHKGNKPVRLSGPLRSALTGPAERAELAELAELAEPRTVTLKFPNPLFPSAGELTSGAAAPLIVQGKPIGLLSVGCGKESPFDEVDAQVLEALAAQVSLTYENLRLHEQSKELARLEERNRIARDLHDSVSQMLFSLQLHARAVESMLAAAPDAVKNGIGEVGRLSRDALTEMRGMIRQLRPPGLEEGLLTGLSKYGERIGLKVGFAAGELRQLPESVETALWRIGQEALNNVRKHSGCESATITLAHCGEDVCMTVSDRGGGMAEETRGASSSGYGMATMRERAEAAGGTLAVESVPGKGTDVSVRIPVTQSRKAGNAD